MSDKKKDKIDRTMEEYELLVKFAELDKKRRRLIGELDKVVAEMAKMIAEAQNQK